MDLEDILRFINLVASGVTAGILVCVLVATVPAMLTLPDGMALSYKQRLDPAVDRVNPAAVMIALVTGILILLVADDLPTTSVVATIVGLVGTAGVIGTSMGINLPINHRMAEWSTESPPPEFRQLMVRWNASHAVRTLSGVTAFVGYVVAVLAVID